MLNRKLLSLLVSLLLTLTPFASLEVAAAGNGHCMMMDMDMGDSDMVGMHHAAGPDSQAIPDCPHCKDDGCNANGCANHGCSTVQSLSLPDVAEIAVSDNRTIKPVASISAGLLSRSTPPLLRPPV